MHEAAVVRIEVPVDLEAYRARRGAIGWLAVRMAAISSCGSVVAYFGLRMFVAWPDAVSAVPLPTGVVMSVGCLVAFFGLPFGVQYAWMVCVAPRPRVWMLGRCFVSFPSGVKQWSRIRAAWVAESEEGRVLRLVFGPGWWRGVPLPGGRVGDVAERYARRRLDCWLHDIEARERWSARAAELPRSAQWGVIFATVVIACQLGVLRGGGTLGEAGQAATLMAVLSCPAGAVAWAACRVVPRWRELAHYTQVLWMLNAALGAGVYGICAGVTRWVVTGTL